MMSGTINDDALAVLGAITPVIDSDTLSGRDPGWHPDNLGAGVAVRPVTIDEVVSIVRWSAAHGIELVPHGGRTGLAGAAASAPGQLVVMLDKLDRVLSVDTSGGSVAVEAGATLEAVEAAVNAAGFTVGIDLAARGSATIGGLIATNAGGIEAFEHGVMRHRVLGLEAVLADGSVMDDLKQVIKANEGYDLKQLFIGAEGTLGIVTRAALRLSPLRANGTAALLACPDARSAAAVFHGLRRQHPGGLRAAEVMYRSYLDAVGDALALERLTGFSDTPLMLLVEIAGLGVDAMSDALEPLLMDELIVDAIIAASEQERADMWRIREESEAVDRLYPHGCWYDVSVPLGDLDAYWSRITAGIAALDPSLGIFVCGHLGDGNLHFTVSNGKRGGADYQAIADVLFAGLMRSGGSFSAEHGIGTEKLGSLRKLGNPVKRHLMLAVKRTLDPDNRMNPGKLFDREDLQT